MTGTPTKRLRCRQAGNDLVTLVEEITTPAEEENAPPTLVIGIQAVLHGLDPTAIASFVVGDEYDVTIVPAR